uniref:BY PROTMAP: gi/472583056/gb/EMS20718.1/ GATA-binding transcription factor [Rhodosporidium toruloides NP11] n=1 Tax=Rhodotorula toruloides TaxID=5286 RepID=A0A0K3CHK4_RHOTO
MSSRGPPSQASQVPSRPFSARPPSPARPLGSIQWSAPRTVYNPTPLPHSVSIPPLYGRRGSTGFYDTPIGQHQVQVAVDEFGRPRHDWGGPSYAYTAPRLATSPTSPPRPQSSFIFTSQSLRQSASPVSPANDVAVASAPPPLAGRRRSIAAGSGDSLPRRPKTPPDCCAVCAVTETAEWRKGPAGNRSLCNGCGLLAAKRAKERELQGFAPPATLDEIERELEAIDAGEDEGSCGSAAGVGAETLKVQVCQGAGARARR